VEVSDDRYIQHMVSFLSGKLQYIYSSAATNNSNTYYRNESLYMSFVGVNDLENNSQFGKPVLLVNQHQQKIEPRVVMKTEAVQYNNNSVCV